MPDSGKTNRLLPRLIGIALGLVVSGAIHIAVLVLLMQLRTHSREQVNVAPTSSEPIQFHPMPSGKNAASANSDAVASARPKQSAAKMDKPNVHARSTTSSPSAKSTTPTIKRFDQLLPLSGLEFSAESVNNDSKPGQGQPRLRGFDVENDQIPLATKTRNISKLLTFAKDVAGLIAILKALQKISSRGTAQARMTRKRDGWQITDTTGDPYFRAILYQTLASLTPNMNGLVMLAASEFQTVRIQFELRTTSVADQTTKPIDISIDGNKIFIVLTREEFDRKWQMLAASPAGLPTVNVLGVGWVLLAPYIEGDPHADIDLKMLRQSPAYHRPIGR